MIVTEVRIKLVPRSEDKLLAFASIIIDGSFVVRDIKIIQTGSEPFVAMPARKITCRCGKCGAKNHLQARFCDHCGVRQVQRKPVADERGRIKLHADVAHPINALCRQQIHDAVLKGYAEELQRSRQPGYAGSGHDDLDSEYENETSRPDALSSPSVHWMHHPRQNVHRPC
jgi:stage V sporulation protein G